jgi:hypothetical protein
MDELPVGRIAERAGVTEAQARAVLAAARELATPASVTSPEAVRRDAPRTEPATGDRMLDAAAWGALAVVLVSVAVYAIAEDGFDQSTRGKAGLLATSVVIAAGFLFLGRIARRRGYRLGEQLAVSGAAILVGVIAWSALWVLGLWPGHEVAHRYGDGYADRERFLTLLPPPLRAWTAGLPV